MHTQKPQLHINLSKEQSNWHAGLNFPKTWVNEIWEKLLSADIAFEDDDEGQFCSSATMLELGMAGIPPRSGGPNHCPLQERFAE